MDLELDKMTDEELIYALGAFLNRKDAPILFAIAVSSASLELESRGIIVKDNGLGNSWTLCIENCSLPNPKMYEEYAWVDKSKAWLFWAGLNMPMGHDWYVHPTRSRRWPK